MLHIPKMYCVHQNIHDYWSNYFFYTDKEVHYFSMETEQYVVFSKGKSECEDSLGTEM